MRRRGLIVAVALIGLVAGAGLTLAFPVSGRRLEPPPSPPERLPRGAVLGAAAVPTLLAWTPGGLPDGYADAVRSAPGVSGAAEVRSGVAWLRAWRDRGEPLETAPRGLAIPIEVAAVDPETYAGFVPPAERAEVLRLGRGDAVLGATAAALRGLEPGGSLTFAGGRTLRVRAVLEDELVGAHEVMVSRAEGAGLGIVRPRYLLVSPAEGTPQRRVRAALRRLVPAGVRVRVRGPGETPVFRHGDAVLPPLWLKELFGEFAAAPSADGSVTIDPAWVRANIADARVPILGRVRCHAQVVPQLREALAEIVRRGLGELIDPGDYGGCFSARFINRDPSAALSHHAWGIAVDLNVTRNGLGAEPTMDRRVVEIMERWGFTWGGRWLVPDGMHFEFLRFPPQG